MDRKASKVSDKQGKAVVLLSGGIDSATVLAIALRDGFDAHALTFAYGQRHHIELKAASTIARRQGCAQHVVQSIDLRCFGGSALTDAIDVPKSGTVAEIAEGIPVTYVPARNTIFLSFALAYAEVIGSTDIFIGVNAVDYSGYPDCRPEFIKAFQSLANLATRAGAIGEAISIHAPLIHMSKAAIISKGASLGVDFGATHSCYDPDHAGLACGRCDSCLLRKEGFTQAGVPDPTKYVP